MTEYMISPTVALGSEGVLESIPKIRDILDSGRLEAYRVRSNGTTRLVRLLPVGSTGRDTAEWISEQVDEGRTVQSVARELHSSVPTIRRFLEALELTEEIEAGEWDDVWAELNGLPLETPVDEMSEEELAEAFRGAEMVDDVMGNRWHASALEAETGLGADDLENTVAPDSEPSNA